MISVVSASPRYTRTGLNASMGFFSSLLPGLRELRSPLAAGYLWLLWLLVVGRNHFPEPTTDSTLLVDSQRLANWLDKGVVLIGAGFVAYILGIISVSGTDRLVALLARWHPRRFSGADVLRRAPLSEKGIEALQGLAVDKSAELLKSERSSTSQTQTWLVNQHPDAAALLSAIGSNLGIDERRRLIQGHLNINNAVGAMVGDLELVPSRLMKTRPEIYTDYERKIAEGQFRGAVAVPLGLLLGTLSLEFVTLTAVWGCVAAAGVTLILFMQARNRTMAAYDDLAATLRASGGEAIGVLNRISDSSLSIVSTQLSSTEIGQLRTLVNGALEQERPAAALEWLEILAKTGDRSANELWCDIARSQFRYPNDDRLYAALAEGSPHSGRIALEFARAAADVKPSGSGDEDAAYAFIAGLISSLRDERTKLMGEEFLQVVRPEIMGLSPEQVTFEVSRGPGGDVPAAILARRYPPPLGHEIDHLKDELDAAIMELTDNTPLLQRRL